MNERPITRCDGCPVIDFHLKLIDTTEQESQAALAQVDERIAHNAISLPSDVYLATLHDLTKIGTILSLRPEAANMTLSAFTGTYRTETNKLGDAGFVQLRQALATDEPEPNMRDAVQTAYKLAQPLAMLPAARAIVEAQLAEADLLDQTRGTITSIARAAIQKQYDDIEQLTSACWQGLTEDHTCGSKAYKCTS